MEDAHKKHAPGDKGKYPCGVEGEKGYSVIDQQEDRGQGIEQLILFVEHDQADKQDQPLDVEQREKRDRENVHVHADPFAQVLDLHEVKA